MSLKLQPPVIERDGSRWRVQGPAIAFSKGGLRCFCASSAEMVKTVLMMVIGFMPSPEKTASAGATPPALIKWMAC